MKLYPAFIFLSLLSLPLRAEAVQPSTTVSCKGPDGKTYKAGEASKDGCIEYVCENNGDLKVRIDDTCCLHKGRYYQVREVVAEIPIRNDCILEHTVCTEGGQVVTEAVYGKCNCEYNGLILKDGDNLTLSTGIEASCFGGAMVTLVNKTSTHPDVKLVGGLRPGMGNVYINNIPVGDCNWDINAATILCQDLGFGDAIEIPQTIQKSSVKNTNIGNFSIKCTGNEASLNDCKITDECNKGGVASVRCSRVKIEENGKNSQVFLDGEPLCVDGKKKKTEGKALCRELGFSNGMLTKSQSQITSSNSISCSQDLLSECITSECSKNSPMASLTCSNKMNIQLLGGNGESEGNVYYDGGPVCDDNFDISDAYVVCRELGFDRAEEILTKSFFGKVTLPFKRDNVNCNGNETTLSKCEALSDSNCGENEGAGVICAMKTHSRKKRAVAAALPAILNSGANVVGGIVKYFDQKEKEHQKYLKERPEMADITSDKISIKMKPVPGYLDPSGDFAAGGYEVQMGSDTPPKKEKQSGGDAFTYANGIGPMLMNGCYKSNYSKGDPCYASKRMSTKCLDQIEAANYVGVGFDGTGEYTHASRKKSLVQRTCAAKSTYHGEDVPDSMNVFGIYDTACNGRSHDSLEARSQFQREQSDMGSNEDLLKYKGGSNTKIKASVGWGSISGGVSSKSNGNKQTQTKNKRSSADSAEANDETTKKMIFEFSCTIRRYNIFLDEVTPEMLSIAFLQDYMSLPIRYYDFRHQAPLRYSSFLQRWGTHYIKSASFGGKFSLLRESRVQGKETKTEWKERVQEDTSSMFEKKESSVEAKAKKEQTKESSAKSAKDEAQANDKSKKSTSYSMDDIIVEGGSQRVAAILADKHRSGFKAEFTEWLDSIPEYPKGYNFRFGELAELLDMNYASLLDHPIEPCWKKQDRYDRKDENGDSICGEGRTCFYKISVKNDKGDEVLEERKCQFESATDFQDQMNRRLLSLRRATDVFIKSGGKTTSEVTLPGGENRCEDQRPTNSKISYNELITGETYRLNFDLFEDIGLEISKDEIMYIFFKQDDENDGGRKLGRWSVGDSAQNTLENLEELNTFAGQYSKLTEVDETKKKVLIKGIQFTYESGKSGNFLKMTTDDCQKNKERIPSMAHQKCDAETDLYWIDIPLANVYPMKMPNTFFPCYLEWSNANMLMSESSCVRFTATSEGPIYFALAAIPNRPDTAYYLRISPTDVTIYKNGTLRNEKTNLISAVGLGHKDIFQTYIICSEHKKDMFTRITYGKLAADETLGKDATLKVYLNMEDDVSPIKPTYFAIGSGEARVQIVDMQQVDLPNLKHMKCQGDTINVKGRCVQACKKSKIAVKNNKKVELKCYKEDSKEELGDADSHVPEGAYCIATCSDNAVAFPDRTVCKGDATWTEELNCNKKCDMKDTAITKGLLVKDGTKTSEDLKDLEILCEKEGVKCELSCGKDQSGLKYTAIGVAECSSNSKWMVNSIEVEHVCRSSPCSDLTKLPNGSVKCDQSAIKTEGYVSEGTQCTLESCNSRFTKGEPSTLTCSDGEWRHGEAVDTLECIPTDKTCPAVIPAIDRGTASCKDTDKSSDGKYLGGTICNVKCEAGYELKDPKDSIIQCVKGGWKINAPCNNKAYAQTGEFTLEGGPKGDWGPKEMCIYPNFVTKMELNIAGKGGDDTALNAIRLTCSDGQTLLSSSQRFGTWRGVKTCPSSSYIKKAQIRREAYQGSNDNTAANGVKFECTDGTKLEPGNGYWGAWSSWKSCPEGSAVVGMKTKVQSELLSSGDNTALNDVTFYCAQIHEPGSVVQGELDSYCRNFIQHKYDACKGNIYARYGSDKSGGENRWRCYRILKKGKMAKACTDDKGQMKECEEPETAGGHYCTRDELSGMIRTVNPRLKWMEHEGMQSDCWTPYKYTKIQPYPFAASTTLSACKKACAENQACGAAMIYPKDRKNKDDLKCYLIKTDNMFDDCDWSGSGNYNVYEKIIGRQTGK